MVGFSWLLALGFPQSLFPNNHQSPLVASFPAPATGQWPLLQPPLSGCQQGTRPRGHWRWAVDYNWNMSAFTNWKMSNNKQIAQKVTCFLSKDPSIDLYMDVFGRATRLPQIMVVPPSSKGWSSIHFHTYWMGFPLLDDHKPTHLTVNLP